MASSSDFEFVYGANLNLLFGDVLLSLDRINDNMEEEGIVIFTIYIYNLVEILSEFVLLEARKKIFFERFKLCPTREIRLDFHIKECLMSRL